MKKRIVFLLFFLLVLSCQCWSEGINTLVEVGKSMAEAKKTLDAETQDFERLKKGIESGAVKRGQSMDSIREQCGEPVVFNEDFLTKRERWVYKSAAASFFKGARIYLYFDKNGALDEITSLQ